MRDRLGLTVDHVDKPFGEEAAGAGCRIWGNSAVGWVCDCIGRVGSYDEGVCFPAPPEDVA